MPAERFIGEKIRPAKGAEIFGPVITGEPLLPRQFAWRKQVLALAAVMQKWKESGPCSSGGGEQYLRKHWYKVKTADGRTLKIYFERQARSQRERTARWWLYSVTTDDNTPTSPPA